MRDVVAALIWEGERFMICQRPAHKARGLLWEFVGGKTEEGETKEEALVRECMEELGIKVVPGDVFMELDHHYPDIDIHLTLFNCAIAEGEGEPQLLEHNDIRWITVGEIPDYEFCPADADILKRLKNYELFKKQRKLLGDFLANGNITEAQYEKSYGDLCRLTGF